MDKLSDKVKYISSSRFLHLDEGEQLFACILDACAKQVRHIIDNQETVVVMTAHHYINRWVLRVMPTQIQLLLRGELAGIDGCSNPSTSLAKHQQGAFIYIIIHQYYRPFSLLDEVGNLQICIEYLAIIENTLNRWKRCADKEIHLFS